MSPASERRCVGEARRLEGYSRPRPVVGPDEVRRAWTAARCLTCWGCPWVYLAAKWTPGILDG